MNDVYQQAREALNDEWFQNECQVVGKQSAVNTQICRLADALEAGETATSQAKEAQKEADYLRVTMRRLEQRFSDAAQRAEKAERRADDLQTALDSISIPDTIALLEQRAEKAEARVKELEAQRPCFAAYSRAVDRVEELEALFRRVVVTKDDNLKYGTIAMVDFPKIEKVLGSGREVVNPRPPPRYDDVFEKGTEWLDSLTPSSRPVPQPPQGAPGAEVDPVREPVAPATERSSAGIAPGEPAADVGTDEYGESGHH